MSMRELEVEITSREVVVAALAQQEQCRLPLSNLDLLLPPLDVGVFFCYENNVKNNNSHFAAKVGALKSGLAKALVSYYPFAGELIIVEEKEKENEEKKEEEEKEKQKEKEKEKQKEKEKEKKKKKNNNNNSSTSGGEPEILCNNRGVEFIEARALDVELREVDFYDADRSVEGKLVPTRKNNLLRDGQLLAVQVTEMKCGGVVVGCTFDHRVADAYSANMFLVAWAAMTTTTNTKTSIRTPTFLRSLLNPRTACNSYDIINPSSSLDTIYVSLSSSSSSLQAKTTNNINTNLDMMINSSSSNNNNNIKNTNKNISSNRSMIRRIYRLPSSQLSHLQSLAASPTNPKPTKLQALSAFLWKLIATHQSISSSSSSSSSSSVLNNNSISRMGLVVDGRTRLTSTSSSSPSSTATTLMDSYFGNVLSLPFASMHTQLLTQMPLSQVADDVAHLVRAHATRDHFLDLIDWVQSRRPLNSSFVARVVYLADQDDGPAFIVSSGRGFPVNDLDFGWGLPLFGSYHFPTPDKCGYVMPMLPMPMPTHTKMNHNIDGADDWVIYMVLFKDQLDFVQDKAPHIFIPFTLP